ncbi:MAG: sugar transferase [Candidatus Magasanikbacteria bacterium]
MKKFELTFTFLQLPLDYLALVMAGFSAYALRYADFVTTVRPILFDLRWPRYWPLVLAVSAGWVIIFAFNGLYHTNPNRKLARDLSRIVFASATGFAGIALYVFLSLQKFDSRFLVLAGWILATIFVCAERILIKLLKMGLNHLGLGLRRTVIVGHETIANRIAQTLTGDRSLGYLVVGQFPDFTSASNKIEALKPDEIIFADPKADEDSALSAIDYANERHIVFKYSADLFATISSNMTIYTIADVPVVELSRTRLTGWGAITKRFFDIIGSIVLIVIFSPIFIICSLVILLETGRPIIYKNERVGRKGKNFFAFKFRSMYQKYCTGAQFKSTDASALRAEAELIKTNSAKSGPVYKIKNDPRVTTFGRFIRRWSLDEIPQFFNVLSGKMSLVGPRPHQPREVAQYQKHHKAVLAIKPGITGMAQISGRSDLSFEEEIKLDTLYIEKWSLLSDLIILAKTPFVVFRKKGVY